MLTMTLYAYCGEEYGVPLNAEGLRWQGHLPCTDRYTVDVASGVDAMRGGGCSGICCLWKSVDENRG